MGTLIPTPKKARSLPSTAGITDEQIRGAFDLLNQNIINLQDDEYTDKFLKFINTSQFAGIFEASVWDFIKRYFVEEQIVRDVGVPASTLKVESKKVMVLPTLIPGNRALSYSLTDALSDSTVANGLGSGYFKIIETTGNKIKIVSGYDESSVTCGYVVEDNKWVAISAEESSTITQSVYVFLELGDKTFKTIPIATVTAGADVSGLKLIGTVIVTDDELAITQEHIGLIDNNFASEPFDIMLASDTTVTLKGGTFQMNDTYETIADSTETITETKPIYIETDGTGSPSWVVGTLPATIDPLIARTIIGRVHFADSKITRIEPYIRGWFHCHVIGDC